MRYDDVISEMGTTKSYPEVLSDIQKYGTSEGVTRSWDTRGRGRKSEETSTGLDMVSRITGQQLQEIVGRMVPPRSSIKTGTVPKGNYKHKDHPTNSSLNNYTFSTPFKHIDFLVAAEKEIPVFKSFLGKIETKLAEYDINIQEIKISAAGDSSPTASYTYISDSITIDSVMLHEPKSNTDQHDFVLQQKLLSGGKYWNATHILTERGIDEVDANTTHEIGHALIMKYNSNPESKDKMWEAIEKLREVMLRDGYATSMALQLGIESPAIRDAKKAAMKIQDSLSCSMEFKKILKQEFDTGWRLPTMYAESRPPEAWAECYTLWKHGATEYLTPDIVKYIEKVHKKMVIK
jgi:hypothetical protein